MVVYLCSEQASGTTGAALRIVVIPGGPKVRPGIHKSQTRASGSWIPDRPLHSRRE